VKPAEVMPVKNRNWNAIAWGIISLGYLILFRYFISDPRNGGPIHLTLPFGIQIPWISCPFNTLTGLPCPICGISRASVLMLHGDIGGSFRMHPLGPVVVIGAVMSVVYLPWAIMGRKELEAGGIRRWIMWGLVGVVLVAWMISLGRHFGYIGW
jgi:hypothetical protein